MTVGIISPDFLIADDAFILEKIRQEGRVQIGELVKFEYPNKVNAAFVYARDIEENIIELQSWDI